jgi:flagellar biosynthetic protein FliQ
MPEIIGLARSTLLTTLWLAAPVLLIAAAVSLVVSIGQVLTSIQDATIATIPKLAAVGAAVFFLMPWFLRKLVSFTAFVFGDFHRYIG